MKLVSYLIFKSYSKDFHLKEYLNLTKTHQFHNLDAYHRVGGLFVSMSCGKGIIVSRRHFDA